MRSADEKTTDLLLGVQRACRAAQGASLAASIKRRVSGPALNQPRRRVRECRKFQIGCHG